MVATNEVALLELSLPTAEENVALDEALLVAADERDGPAVMRIWEQPDYAVVLGASRRIADDVWADRCREDGVPIIRRASGGGTVVIGPGALNVALILPISAHPALASVDGAQLYILNRLAAAIRARGPEVEVLGSGDLTLGGRKFAGSAQRRLRRWILVHASILHNMPIARVCRYLRHPERQPDYRGRREHEEFLLNLPMHRTILNESIRSAWPLSHRLDGASNVSRDLLETLLAEKFANRSWIERF